MPNSTVRGLCNFCACVVLSVTIHASAWADTDPTAPPAEWTVTGSATVASQYRYRGISQSDNRPVIQGAITVAHASGFYVATWGSSASQGNGPVDIGGTELDIYGGYTHALGHSGIVIDSGLYGYVFAGMSKLNFYEIYGSLSETLGPVTAKLGTAFAPAQKVFDYNLSSAARDNLYVYGDVSAGIPRTPITLHSHLAHTGGGLDYARPYFDYSVGATAKWKSLALDLSLVGATVSHDDIARSGLAGNGSGGIDALKLDAFYRQGKPVAVVSLTASF
jgi:uncharacterized protein (TIGR02001 family)